MLSKLAPGLTVVWPSGDLSVDSLVPLIVTSFVSNDVPPRLSAADIILRDDAVGWAPGDRMRGVGLPRVSGAVCALAADNKRR